MKDLNRARAFFQADRYAMEVTGVEIDAVDEGFARCSLALNARHCNAGQAIQGGAIFTLADFAFAVASNDETPRVVSLSNQITFHRQPRGKRLIASAHREAGGRTVAFYIVQVRDELDTLVATMTVNGYAVSRPEA